LSEPIRATIASIADMRFRFDKDVAGFELTILANDAIGKPVEVILRDDMAIGIADDIIFAIEQNEIRSARIAAGLRLRSRNCNRFSP